MKDDRCTQSEADERAETFLSAHTSKRAPKEIKSDESDAFISTKQPADGDRRQRAIETQRESAVSIRVTRRQSFRDPRHLVAHRSLFRERLVASGHFITFHFCSSQQYSTPCVYLRGRVRGWRGKSRPLFCDTYCFDWIGMAPMRPGPHGGGGTSRARVERLIFVFLFVVVVVSCALCLARDSFLFSLPSPRRRAQQRGRKKKASPPLLPSITFFLSFLFFLFFLHGPQRAGEGDAITSPQTFPPTT